ncbi:MAG: YHS domain-containing (seleno)protein [Pseudomonadota bacterium]
MKYLALLALLATIFVSHTSFADVDTDTDSNDVILAGHDAVAYQTENQAVIGSPEYTTVYNGAIYRFASSKNRDLFNKDPEKYAPAYGGYCAYGMTFGKKFEVDGKAFQVVDGKLYVNKNLSVYNTWKKDIPGNIEKANTQWPKVKDVAPSDL